MTNKEFNKTLILVTFAVVAFIIAIFGITYAYHQLQISGNPSSMTVDLINLGTVTFADGNVIDAENIQPVVQATRDDMYYYGRRPFQITAASNTNNVPYVVKLEVRENEFQNNFENEFTYTLTGENNGTGSISIPHAQAEIPTGANTLTIAEGSLGSGGETHSYVLNIGLNEVGSRQNYNQGKDFNAIIVVELDTQKYTGSGELWSLGS